MTYRQKVLKAVYPFFMWITKITGTNSKKIENSAAHTAILPFYDLSATQNDGTKISLSEFSGKKVMVVNTASACGYTNQYSELQHLYEKYQNKMVILAFPSNDFKEQEKGTDVEIAEFCKLNFGITFPLMKKSVVVKSAEQNPVFQWLSDSSKNGWCNHEPSWNFSKYLINEKGMLTNYFDPSVSPLSKSVIDAVSK
ncbi:MAG: glutathione peroxidase [Chitinophagaceae bacterium]|nr:glutathione peroxidase [Chitinophagaceae bacterium]MBK8951985.1 glutathione peroxidase [Chitinophagaceae bacterium]